MWDSLHHEQGKCCFQNEEVAFTSANHQPAHHSTALERRKLHSLLLMTPGTCPRGRALLEEQAWMTLDFQRLLEKQVFYITSREKEKNQGWRKTYRSTNCLCQHRGLTLLGQSVKSTEGKTTHPLMFPARGRTSSITNIAESCAAV